MEIISRIDECLYFIYVYSIDVMFYLRRHRLRQHQTDPNERPHTHAHTQTYTQIHRHIHRHTYEYN